MEILLVEQGRQDIKSFHLAGIVPVAGQKLDFNFPWHDCMMPIAPDYLAVESAVHECAAAGCETIWIVCHKEMQPLIRYRIGDWIEDPQTQGHIKARYTKFPSEHLKRVPIYYVPVHPKDRDKRDCLSWSVLYGVMRAFHVSKLISKWVVPDRYYVSFPYGIYSTKMTRQIRREISSKKRVFLSHGGKTVADGLHLGFTMDANDFIMYRKNLRDLGTGQWTNSFWDEEARTIKGTILPVEERYSARYFDLDTVFGCATIEEERKFDVGWYHDVSTWEGYCQFLASEERKQIKRPYKMNYHEWNPIGQDKEDE